MFNGGARPIDEMENPTGIEEINILDKCLEDFNSLCENDHELDLGNRTAYQGETISSGMGYNFSKLTGKMCLVSEHGFGGKSYVELKKGTIAYNNSIRAVKHAKELCDRYGWNYEVVGVAVVHGEADSVGSTTETQYVLNLIEWQNDYDEDIKAITGQNRDVKLFVSQTASASALELDSSPIANAVYLASLQSSNIKLVTAQYIYPITYASVHMNNYGYRTLGEYFGLEIGRDFNEYPDNVLYPTESVYDSTNNTITITFNAANNIQFDTNNVAAVSDGNYGFELIDNTNNVNILNVGILNNKVVIALDGELAEGTKISYAYKPTADEMGFIGYQKGLRGNLRSLNGFTSYFDSRVFAMWGCIFCIPVNFGD